MRLARWKIFFAGFVSGLLVINAFRLSDADDGLKAATYALIASGILFVGFVPGEGDSNRLAVFILQYSGAAATFLAAWYWVLDAGGLNSDSHIYVAGAVLAVIVLVILTRALSPFFRRNED